MENNLIRSPQPGDLAALEGVIAATGLFPPELLGGMMAGNAEGAPSLWQVLERDGPVALAYAAPERMMEGTWNLLLIAVHPDVQGKGFGTALMAEVEALLRAEGQRLLLVETSDLPEFEATRAFYFRRGYRQEAHIRDFYAAGEGKIVFVKAL